MQEDDYDGGQENDGDNGAICIQGLACSSSSGQPVTTDRSHPDDYPLAHLPTTAYY